MNRDPIRLQAFTLAMAVLMTGCAAPPASSEPQSRTLPVEQVAGFWGLSTPSGRTRCTVSLSNFLIDGRYAVLAENCQQPQVVGARNWRPTATGFELLSAEGAVILAFRRTGEDAFRSARGDLTLTRAPL